MKITLAIAGRSRQEVDISMGSTLGDVVEGRSASGLQWFRNGIPCEADTVLADGDKIYGFGRVKNG